VQHLRADRRRVRAQQVLGGLCSGARYYACGCTERWLVENTYLLLLKVAAVPDRAEAALLVCLLNQLVVALGKAVAMSLLCTCVLLDGWRVA
jgi:hypothetical protein